MIERRKHSIALQAPVEDPFEELLASLEAIGPTEAPPIACEADPPPEPAASIELALLAYTEDLRPSSSTVPTAVVPAATPAVGPAVVTGIALAATRKVTPPDDADLGIEEAPVSSISPSLARTRSATIARKKKLRGGVAGVLGLAGILALVPAVRTIQSASRTGSGAHVVTVAPRTLQPMVLRPLPPPEASVTAVAPLSLAPEAQLALLAPPGSAHAAPAAAPTGDSTIVASAPEPLTPPADLPLPAPAAPRVEMGPDEAAPATVAAADPVPAPVVSGPAAASPSRDRETASFLASRARRSLELGNLALAIDLGRAAVAADDGDAAAYVLLGTALLEQGDRRAARDVFAACLKTAERGPKAACEQPAALTPPGAGGRVSTAARRVAPTLARRPRPRASVWADESEVAAMARAIKREVPEAAEEEASDPPDTGAP